MSKSKKRSRLAQRSDAMKRHRGDNSLYNDNKYAYVLPLGLSWVLVFALVIGLCFVFSKKHMEDTRGRVTAEEARKRELVESLQRETTLWEQMKSPSQLRVALLNNGVKMSVSPSASQRVAMGSLPDYENAPEPAGTRYASR